MTGGPPTRHPPAPGAARSLQALAVLYGGLLVVAGLLGFKLVKLGPLAVPGGVFAFLLAIVTVNATAELHGRAVAQRLVLMGYVPMTVAILLMQLVLFLPGADGWQGQATAEAVFGASVRLIVAGMIAYGISQTLDVTIFTWLRGRPAALASGKRRRRNRADGRHADLRCHRLSRHLPAPARGRWAAGGQGGDLGRRRAAPLSCGRLRPPA